MGGVFPLVDEGRCAVLFDLDETLVDHRSAVMSALGELFRGCAAMIERNEWDFRSVWCGTAKGADGELDAMAWVRQGRARVRAAFGRADLSDVFVDRCFSSFVEAYEGHWRLFPDAIPCLDALRGRSMGVVTNGWPWLQRRKLCRLGLSTYFREVLISGEVGEAKPSPGIFLEASRRLRCAPSDCVVVGDSWEKDVEGGLRAGMRSVWLDRSGVFGRSGVLAVKDLWGLCHLVGRGFSLLDR